LPFNALIEAISHAPNPLGRFPVCGHLRATVILRPLLGLQKLSSAFKRIGKIILGPQLRPLFRLTQVSV
jgi:hypothetical protein